ncbi:hypothetical protein KC358_g3 [Hortaea werneckii]|nr:hypothetical protein KC358_g3 [Hortaea werneckii]
MFGLLSRWSLLVAAVQLCASSPLPIAEVSLIEQANLKRSMGGPLIGGANFPGAEYPSVIQVGNTWYAFATRTIGSSIHIQMALKKTPCPTCPHGCTVQARTPGHRTLFRSYVDAVKPCHG